MQVSSGHNFTTKDVHEGQVKDSRMFQLRYRVARLQVSITFMMDGSYTRIRWYMVWLQVVCDLHACQHTALFCDCPWWCALDPTWQPWALSAPVCVCATNMFCDARVCMNVITFVACATICNLTFSCIECETCMGYVEWCRACVMHRESCTQSYILVVQVKVPHPACTCLHLDVLHSVKVSIDIINNVYSEQAHVYPEQAQHKQMQSHGLVSLQRICHHCVSSLEFTSFSQDRCHKACTQQLAHIETSPSNTKQLQETLRGLCSYAAYAISLPRQTCNDETSDERENNQQYVHA